MDLEFILPYHYLEYKWQRPMVIAFKAGKIIWMNIHRRGGKDLICFCRFVLTSALRRPGTYPYTWPTLKQGRDALWEGKDEEGRDILDYYVPKEAILHQDNADMKLTLRAQGGTSTIQIFGTNQGQYEALRGKPANGVVYSEHARQDPRVVEVVSPMIAKTNGWEIYNSTPNGSNHFKEGYFLAKRNPETNYVITATVEDTYDHNGNPLVTKEALQKERDKGRTEDHIQQEYYCSFLRGIEGTYLGKQLQLTQNEGRINNQVLYDENAPVYTVWDLGVGDFMSIIFFQLVGQEVRNIDYYENSGYSFVHYAQVLKDRGYYYGAHYAPHDIYVREMGAKNSNEPRAISRLENAADLGINFEPLERISFESGIEHARSIMRRCFFHEEKCKVLLSHLEQWGRKWNNITQEYSDWEDNTPHKHAGAAFRYLAQVVVEGTHTASEEYSDWEREQDQAALARSNQYTGSR